MAASVAATALLAGCGGSGQTVTFTTTPTSTGTAHTATARTTGTGTVQIDRLVGPEGVDYESNPELAAAGARHTGAPVDGIQCQSLRQFAHLAYAHLQIYVRGRPRALPGGIGMVQPSLSQTSAGPQFTASRCYYWLHTTTQDGVIAVESPVDRSFTLGQFFAIWGRPLSRSQVGPARGHVTATVDGHRWHGDPRSIRLREHEAIELAVGRPLPAFTPVTWPIGAL